MCKYLVSYGFQYLEKVCEVPVAGTEAYDSPRGEVHVGTGRLIIDTKRRIRTEEDVNILDARVTEILKENYNNVQSAVIYSFSLLEGDDETGLI